jgi:hypothetical protein
MLGDPISFSANFINIGALSKRSKFGKNVRCLHILETEKISKFLHFRFVRIVKYSKFAYILWEI